MIVGENGREILAEDCDDPDETQQWSELGRGRNGQILDTDSQGELTGFINGGETELFRA